MTEELKTLKDLMIGQIDIGYMDIIRKTILFILLIILFGIFFITCLGIISDSRYIQDKCASMGGEYYFQAGNRFCTINGIDEYWGNVDD